MTAPTRREQRKAERRSELLRAATSLFAERGFRAVSVEELGAAAGVSGPAVYRHFPSKEAMLADLLVGVSERLLAGGRARARSASSPDEALARLIAFHADFAVTDRDLIRIQDHDLASLPARESKAVRQLQRAYLEVWVDVLREIEPDTTLEEARTKVQAVFGLLNSTSHLSPLDGAGTRRVLEAMARRALSSDVPRSA